MRNFVVSGLVCALCVFLVCMTLCIVANGWHDVLSGGMVYANDRTSAINGMAIVTATVAVIDFASCILTYVIVEDGDKYGW